MHVRPLLQVNVRGVQFYSDLVDELLKYNIEPYVYVPIHIRRSVHM